MQYVANALISAGFILLSSLGFFLVFRVSGFLNFSHGLFVAAGGYFTFVWIKLLGVSVWTAAVLALVSVGVAAYLLDRVLLSPLRQNGATSLVLLLATIGVYEAGQNLIAMAYGDATRSFRSWEIGDGWSLFGGRFTQVHLTTICLAVLTLGILWVMLRVSRFGLRWEAVASDPFLAAAHGIDAERVHREVVVTSAVIAAMAGILLGADVDITPQMGLSPMMLAATAVLIGGQSLMGVAAGSLAVAGARHLAALWLASQWQDTVTFLLLFAFLVFRPQGLLGHATRRTSV